VLITAITSGIVRCSAVVSSETSRILQFDFYGIGTSSSFTISTPRKQAE